MALPPVRSALFGPFGAAAELAEQSARLSPELAGTAWAVRAVPGWNRSAGCAGLPEQAGWTGLRSTARLPDWLAYGCRSNHKQPDAALPSSQHPNAYPYSPVRSTLPAPVTAQPCPWSSTPRSPNWSVSAVSRPLGSVRLSGLSAGPVCSGPVPIARLSNHLCRTVQPVGPIVKHRTVFFCMFLHMPLSRTRMPRISTRAPYA